MNTSKISPSVIERNFKASKKVLFDAWTKVEHLKNWMFPMPGCKCEFTSANIVSGGTSIHKITMPNGQEMWLFTKYEEVEPDHKLVFLQYMSNEKGEILPNPQMPHWPKDMVATVLLEDVENNETKLTFLWEPRNPAQEELQIFELSRPHHCKSWGAGMEQLETYLKGK